MLLLQLAQQQTTRSIERFSFRAIGPLFDLAPFRLVAQTDACTVMLEAHAPDRTIALSAIATLGAVNANSFASHSTQPA